MTYTGVTDIFFAVDGHDESRHRIRRTSSKEYYHLCGYNETSAQRRRWTAMEWPEWNQLVQQMPKLRTANVDHIRGVIEYRLHNFAAIIESYDRDFRYRQQQRAFHEVCRRHTFGSEKYGRHISPQHVNANRARKIWRALFPLDCPYEEEQHHYTIAFGNDSFGNMRSKRPNQEDLQAPLLVS